MLQESVADPNFVLVCAWTGRINMNGKWIPIEDYLTSRFGIRITHGISEDGARTIMDELTKDPPVA